MLGGAAIVSGLRAEQNLSQEAVAQGLGVSVATVYRIEAAERELTASEIGLLAHLGQKKARDIVDLIERWADSRGKSK